MKNTTDKSRKKQNTSNKNGEKIKSNKIYSTPRPGKYITESDKNNSEKWIY